MASKDERWQMNGRAGVRTEARQMVSKCFAATVVAVVFCAASSAYGDMIYQTLPFSQDWSGTGLIITNDDWSGVPGIVGFRGDGLTSVNDVDPQTILSSDDPGVVDVIANQLDPNTLTTGGVAEFDSLLDPVVALQGSGTADAPYLRLHLDTTGAINITVSYNLLDIDGSLDNAVQQVALQYRLGDAGDFINIPAAYVADASSGPSLATLVTPVSVTLPSAVDNQALVQLRIITSNASGSDEWIGIDDIVIVGLPTPVPEPSSLLLLGTGLMALGLWSRMRKDRV